jgi:hypothetical protein
MKRPKGMARWEWERRNDPPSKEQLAQEMANRLLEMKESGVEWVEWITAGTGDTCKHCAAMEGKVMRISAVKFTEHPKCEHEDGCRCVLIAVGKPPAMR